MMAGSVLGMPDAVADGGATDSEEIAVPIPEGYCKEVAESVPVGLIDWGPVGWSVGADCELWIGAMPALLVFEVAGALAADEATAV